MTEKTELSDKIMDVATSKPMTKPKRKVVVRVKGQYMFFDNMRQYFEYRQKKKEAQRKTDELYKEGQIKPPEFYSFSQT